MKTATARRTDPYDNHTDSETCAPGFRRQIARASGDNYA
jgi:hypothetical protein